MANNAAARASANGAMMTATNVTKRFKVRETVGNESVGPDGLMVAVDNLTLECKTGELLSLLGPSGCGKTTLLRMVAGLLTPEEGEIRVAGDIVLAPRKDACMVFQDFGLLPWRTVQDNVEFPLEIDGTPKSERRDKANHYLGIVGLHGFEQHYPHELSGGMQQRVGIARALMREPILLLMDEPFGALDAQTREQLQEDFLNIWQTLKTTVLFVTHSIDESLILSDRICVFTPRPGKIRKLIDSPVAPYRQEGDVRSHPEFVSARAEIRRLLKTEK